MKKELIILIVLLSTLFAIKKATAQEWNNESYKSLSFWVNPTYQSQGEQIGFSYGIADDKGKFYEFSLSVKPCSDPIYLEGVMSFGGVLDYKKFTLLFGGRFGLNYYGKKAELGYMNEVVGYVYKVHVLAGVMSRLEYNIYEELHIGLQLWVDFIGYENEDSIQGLSAIYLTYKF